MSKKFKIKKGDQVVLTTGRDKGKKGEVLRVLRDEDRVVVQGVNVVKKHQSASQTSQGGIIEQEASVHISNIALVDPKSGDATRVGLRTEGDRKVRFAKKSGEVVDV
ncbi:50S ribosomal protein L24 [Kiloniella spongiae]|uniref:Large ribosomal subunit protein uL24 n=1 Tax=Kiloniella spongiae TaxID=1489064 RepID=A0A0H2MX10_9PROT|nr:50S ribosomal protein L24 [Kiloniella spongiae]KLN61245.1 50S ribosomal protein L24 [Kiloniella spongiae]